MLTYSEKKWLKEYHERILKVLSDGLSKEERSHLENIVSSFRI